MNDLTAELASDERVQAACRRHGVESLYLFGSRSRAGEARPNSDVDLLVRFRPMTPRELTDAFFGLEDALTGTIAARVDLVMESAVTNPYLKTAIDRTKRVVYGE